MVEEGQPKEEFISMDLIDEPGGVVRLEINETELRELADSIKEVELLQPVLVRPNGDRFEIVAGHRRFLAHRLLDRAKIHCVVRSLSDIQCALARATENLSRVDISPIEEAAIYTDLRDNHNLTIPEIGRRMSKSGGVIKRRLDLLKMPPQLQKAIHSKYISYSVAEELWRLGNETDIDYYLAFAVEHGATQSVVRVWVKDAIDAKRRQRPGAEGTGEEHSPMEPRPVYVACDVCREAMEVGKEIIIRACPSCTTLIREAVKGP